MKKSWPMNCLLLLKFIPLSALIFGAAAVAQENTLLEKQNIELKLDLKVKKSRSYILSGGIPPKEIEVKIIKVGFSKSPYCSEFSTINATQKYHLASDLTQIVTGKLTPGEYRCIGVEINSVIKVTSSKNSKNNVCPENLEFEVDLCQKGQKTQLLSGETKECQSGVSDTIALYFSTEAIESTDSIFLSLPPTAEDKKTGALPLLEPFSVYSSKTSEGRLIISTDASITEKVSFGQFTGHCEMELPHWVIEQE